MSNPLFDRLFAAGAAEAPAIDAGPRRYSYGDLMAETGRVANALADLGVGPGDRVVVQLDKSVASLVLYLACVRAGAPIVPLNPAYTLAELAYFIADAQPALIVCDPARAEGVAGLAGGARIETLDGAGEGSLADRAAASPARFSAVDRTAEDLAAICYTSGTTGRSKGAMLSQRALATNAQTLAALWRFTADDVLIHALPIYHVHGLFVAVNVALMAGAAMIFQPRFEAEAVIEAMPRATALMGVPTYYTRLLASPRLTREAAGPMRLFVSGSAPLLAATHRQWQARTGHAILERYGMTETGMNASNPYDGLRIPGAVGQPLPGVELRVASEAGAPASPGEIGQVEVRGPNLFSGYWRDPAKTGAAFTADGWFRTGDLGAVGADGYLRLSGRGGDLIITGGLNVYPAEVEAAIDAVPGVVESAVIGLPHGDFGEAVTAVVVCGSPPVSEQAILAALQSHLAGFKRPRAILFAGELPRNAMGKVVKAALRSAHADLYGGAVGQA
ncbi:MAG TPA: AMP-binding protein [Caulobacteraceae bacterium]|jgi:malonyl-CoA/methylmalonyl-CoA synthetase